MAYVFGIYKYSLEEYGGSEEVWRNSIGLNEWVNVFSGGKWCFEIFPDHFEYGRERAIYRSREYLNEIRRMCARVAYLQMCLESRYLPNDIFMAICLVYSNYVVSNANPQHIYLAQFNTYDLTSKDNNHMRKYLCNGKVKYRILCSACKYPISSKTGLCRGVKKHDEGVYYSSKSSWYPPMLIEKKIEY